MLEWYTYCMRNATAYIVLVILFALQLFPPFVVRGADTTEARVSVGNVPPVISVVNISETMYGGNNFPSGITPEPGANKLIYVNGVVSDGNGDTTLATTSLVFYRSGVWGGSLCSPDKNECYHTPVCAVDREYGSGTEVKFSCQVPLSFFADSTDDGGRFPGDVWIAEIAQVDIKGARVIATSSVEVRSVLAAEAQDTLSFGAKSLGEETSVSTNQELKLKQAGNFPVTIEVKGSDLACSGTSSVPVENQKWSLQDVGYSDPSAISLAIVGTSTGLVLPYRDDDHVDIERVLYFNMAMPRHGVSGKCTGTTVISVVSAEGERREGVLIYPAAEGVRYESASYSGYTTADGKFFFKNGERMKFKIGNVVLDEIDTTVIPSDGRLFLQDITKVSRKNTTDTNLIKLARFIHSLDEDYDIDDGIIITSYVHGMVTEVKNLSAMSDMEMDSIVSRVYHKRKLKNPNATSKDLKKALQEYGILP